MPTRRSKPAASSSNGNAAEQPTRRAPRPGLPPKPPLAPPGTVKLWASLRRLWDSVVPITRAVEVSNRTGPTALPPPESTSGETNDNKESSVREKDLETQGSPPNLCSKTPRSPSPSLPISRRWRGADRNGAGGGSKDEFFSRSASSPPKIRGSRTPTSSPPPPNRRLRLRSASSNAIQTCPSNECDAPPTNSTSIMTSSSPVTAQKSSTTRQFKLAPPQPTTLSRSSSLRDVSFGQRKSSLVVSQKQRCQRSTESHSTDIDDSPVAADKMSSPPSIANTEPQHVEKDTLVVPNATDSKSKKNNQNMGTTGLNQNRRTSFNPTRASSTTTVGAATTLRSFRHPDFNKTNNARSVQEADDSSPTLSKDNPSRCSSTAKNSKNSTTHARRQWARVSATSRLLMLSGASPSQSKQESANKNNGSGSSRGPGKVPAPSPRIRDKSLTPSLKQTPPSTTQLTRRKSAISVTESSARRTSQSNILGGGDSPKAKDRSAPGSNLVKFKSAVVYGTRSPIGTGSSGRSSSSATSSTQSDIANTGVNSQATKKSENRSRALSIQRNKFSDASLEIRTNTNQLCSSLPNIVVNIPPIPTTPLLRGEGPEQRREQTSLVSRVSDADLCDIHGVDSETDVVNDEFEMEIRETDLSPLIRPSPDDASSLQFIRPASYIRHIMTEKSRTALSAPGSPRGSGFFVGIPMHSPASSPSRKLKLTSAEPSSSYRSGVSHGDRKSESLLLSPQVSTSSLPLFSSSRIKLPSPVNVAVRDKQFAITRLAARRASDCIPYKLNDCSSLPSFRQSLTDRWNVEMRLTRLQTLVRQLRQRQNALPNLQLRSTVSEVSVLQKTKMPQASVKNVNVSTGKRVFPIRRKQSVYSKPVDVIRCSENEGPCNK